MANRSKFQNYFEYYGLKFIMFFIFLFPRSFAQKIGQILVVLVYPFIHIRKKYVIEALTLSFPKKTSKEIKHITKNIYKNFTKTIVDIMFFPKMEDEKIKKMMVGGENIFEDALSKGKGVVMMSAHFGNWELTALATSKRYPVSVIVAKQSNDLIDRMINDVRTQRGFNLINRDDKMSYRNILRALKRNEIVAVLSDQDAGRQGSFVPFFGRLASTPKGAALFALHSGCPLITAFGVRQEDGSMQMKFSEIPMPNTGNQDKDVEIINTIYAQKLEEVVREYPEQWFWFHRKWKTQP